MTSQEFGELIRTQREAKGLYVEELASRFKLSASTLRAIEAGNFSHLPHAVYARGFVRSYAQAVGVDSESVNAGIDVLFPSHLFEDVPTVPGPINAKQPKPRSSGGDKMVATILILVLLILPLGVGWFIVVNYGDAIMDMIKRPLSAVSTPATSEAPRTTFASVTSPAASLQEDSTLVSLPAQLPATTLSEANEPVQTTSSSQGVALAATVSPATAPTVTGPEVLPLEGKQVAIAAREECWVQATVDGAPVRTFRVYPGETSLLPYKRKITLLLGNAGGVSVMHNGQLVALNAKSNETRNLVFP